MQAVDVEAVAVTVKELVSYALTLNPNNQSWLITQADIYFGTELLPPAAAPQWPGRVTASARVPIVFWMCPCCTVKACCPMVVLRVSML
jgi:hypothetical protein